MQALGIISLLIAVCLGVLWLVNSPGYVNSLDSKEVGVNYQKAIDSAYAIPGTPSSTKSQ